MPPPNRPTIEVSLTTHPPFFALHKVQLLDAFLQTLDLPQAPRTINDGQAASNDSNAMDKQLEARRTEVLRVAHSLFGSTLSSALKVLQDQMITKIASIPSGRKLYLVKCKDSNSRRGGKSEESGSYFCMLPEQQDCRGMQYCSCRSFLENSKASLSSFATMPSKTIDNSQTCSMHSLSSCKHLLALKLIPALQVQCNIIETVSDDAFSALVVNRIAGGRG